MRSPNSFYRGLISPLVILLPLYVWMSDSTVRGVRGQGDSTRSQDTIVALGEDTMVPGYPVTIPVELKAVGLSSVGKIELEVTVPTAKVSFDGIRPGIVADQINAEIGSDVQEVVGESGRSVIKVTVAPKKGVAIPPGFLFDFVFRVSKEMSAADPPVVLKSKVQVYGTGEGAGLLSNVETKDGLIRVVPVPSAVTSCFFYMH